MDQTAIFRALADPTRRAVYEKLALGEKAVSALTEDFDISQPAVSQHLAVLRKAGLVAERRAGRQIFYRVEPEGLRPVFDWLGRYRAFWPTRVERLRTLIKEMDQ